MYAGQGPKDPQGTGQLARLTPHRMESWNHGDMSTRLTALDRERIVDAAVRIIDAHGASTLTMRRLALELGSGVMSLYRHVRNKNELLDLALDSIMGELDLPPASTPWDEALMIAARRLRELLHRHRHFALVLGSRNSAGPRTLGVVDRGLGLLRTAGFSDLGAWHALSVTTDYVFGFTLLEILRDSQAEDSEGAPASYLAFIQRLPPDLFPSLVGVASVMGTENERFEYGIQAVVNGIRSCCSPAARPQTRPQQ